MKDVESAGVICRSIPLAAPQT